MAASVDETSSLLSLTENNSPTFSSSADPCVDFFFHIVPDTPSSRVTSLLGDSWKLAPLTALKLVFHLRGVRVGKANKQAFYTCSSWLQQRHPKSLHTNLHMVPKFGYYKDLLEMVLREVEGPEETEKKLAEKAIHDAKVQAAKAKSGMKKSRIFGKEEAQGLALAAASGEKGYWARKGAAAKKAKEDGVLQEREVRIAASLEQDRVKKEMASQLRKQKREAYALRYRTKLQENPEFASMHEAVADIFAKQLVADKKALEAKKHFDISFAAKWCPSLRKSYDLRTGLHHAIASRLFCEDELAHLDEEKRAVALVDKMRKEFLVPLRQALKLPEIYMSANRWNEVPYERLTSVAMSNHVDDFIKHDSDRYVKFLKNVSAGKKKVAAGALLPHEIVRDAVQWAGSPEGILAEEQWKRMVSDLKERGSSRLNSSLAICDVSASMQGTPMEVCIALGLLVAELSEESFKGYICTFSRTPQIHSLYRFKTLAARYQFTENMDWNINTDFLKVFRTLLDFARTHDLPKEKMIKRLFVFSDMEFDEASANPWETDYVMITKMYEEAGYGEPPEIVFWNLRDSVSTPVLSNQKGVALVSGFSKNLLKIFLDESTEISEEQDQEEEEANLLDGNADSILEQISEKKEVPKVDPRSVMNTALTGQLFEDLKVVD